jgi:hypothetical protein
MKPKVELLCFLIQTTIGASETLPRVSFAPEFAGNYVSQMRYSNDTQLLQHQRWNNVSDFLNQIGYIHDPQFFRDVDRLDLIGVDGTPNRSVIRTTYLPGFGASQGLSGLYARPGGPYTGFDRFTLEYEVFFPSNFSFVRGGILPGFWGKNDNSTAFDCTGSVNTEVHDCFSVRLLWRESGLGAIRKLSLT